MEHRKTEFKWMPWVGALCLACLLTACKQPIEHPETLDPIYSDLVAQAGGMRGKAELQKKKIEELQAKISKYGPRDPEAKRTAHELESVERALRMIEQEAQYLDIRAEQRRIYDKEAYLKAFKADESWPPAADYKEYQDTKKLKRASRDWNKSVPVDRSHNHPVEEKKKKKKKKKRKKLKKKRTNCSTWNN